MPHDMFPHSSSSLNFYSYYYHFIRKRRTKKKNKMWPIQPWPKNWQCGMKIKGGINSKENRDPFKVY